MTVDIHPLEASRREDFFGLHCPESGAGWCFCMAWWVLTWRRWGERTAQRNHPQLPVYGRSLEGEDAEAS